MMMFRAPCPDCIHWRRRCRHPAPGERVAGGEPGDEQTVRDWLGLADIDGRSGVAPGRCKTSVPCPGLQRRTG